MNQIKRIVKNAYWVGLRSLLIPYTKKYLSKSLTIFNFHQIAPHFDPKFHSIATWTSLDFFKRQIYYIKKCFKIISLEEGIQRIESNELNTQYASITFDDGDISIQQYAIPFLIENKLNATLFINSAYLDSNKACWFNIFRYLINDNNLKNIIPAELTTDFLQLRNTDDKNFYQSNTKKIENLFHNIPKNHKFYINADFLENLDIKYIHIGLHGHEHHRFSMLNKEQKIEDINNNIQDIKQYRGYKPFFAFPFGKPMDCDLDSIKIILDKNLKIFLHNGGINFNKEILFKRIPSDNQNIKYLISRNSSIILI